MKNKSFMQRFEYAVNGIISAIKSEASFRFQLIAAIGIFIFLMVFGAKAIWWAAISLVIGGVLSTELLNTALEHFMDLMHPEVHPAIKIAKDCAAGAVLVLSIVSIIIFICFIYDRFNFA